MNGTLQWLLGLRTLQPGQDGVRFGFEHPLPAWAWALVAVGAITLAVLAYRRLEGSRLARGALGTLRVLFLVTVAVLLTGPRLIKPNETEEKDWVLVLVDRTASLTVRDAPGADDSSARITRDAQLRAALEASKPVWQSLGAERVVVWLGFDAGAYELPPAGPGSPLPKLGEPVGRRTDISRALDQALKRAAARPLSGVIVLSDGRSVEEPGRTILRQLESQRVPVFTVALGSSKGIPDISVKRVDAPRSAFTKDTIPVQVEVERTGPGAIDPGEGATVELIDTATGAVLDTRTIDWAGEDDAKASAPQPADTSSGELTHRSRGVILTTRPTLAGASRWQVRVKPISRSPDGAPVPADVIETNNTAPLSVELVDRPIRVAFFDGYPRWEYRYLKNLLVRERSFSSVVMLLAPGKRYIQEGTIILDALPRSPEEWSKFDVIVLGDVWPGVFTPEQLEQIKQRIAVGGAGLIWIGGDGPTPGGWRGTAMSDLVPFSLGESAGSGSASRSGPPSYDNAELVMRPTPAADRLGVLRMTETENHGSFWPPALSDPNTGWSILRWAQRIDPATLKPTAETLATVIPTDEVGTTAGTPAVISMRFGAGRVLYVATDEIWRWRYGQGERLPERFWVQLIRLLGRESLARSERSALLEVAPDRAEVGRPVRVSVTLLDQSLVDAAPSSIRVRLRAPVAGAGDIQTVAELTLAPEGGPTNAPHAGVNPVSGSVRTYATTWIPTEPGRLTAEVTDPLVTARALGDRAQGGLTVGVEVYQPDDEMRQPQTDHPLLARLSQSTGGKVLTPERLADLPKLLPNRKLRLAGEPEIQTLWDSPLALILVITLLTAEWVGRRLLRLV